VAAGIAPWALATETGGSIRQPASLTGISGWTWWRTTMTFMQFLHDFRKWGKEK
jgi:hypothetical protein